MHSPRTVVDRAAQFNRDFAAGDFKSEDYAFLPRSRKNISLPRAANQGSNACC
jgi:hypothetical protein